MQRLKFFIIFIFSINLILLSIIIFVPNNKKTLIKSLSKQAMPDHRPSNQIIRQPAVAGQFYPAQPDELRAMLDKFLTAAQIPSFTGQPQILIVPHAGYIFSGPTAAYAFKALQGQTYDNIIIIGPSHHYPAQQLTLYAGDAAQTPLGTIPVNRQLVQQLIIDNQHITADNQVHDPEHSLEVQLPFLQITLKNNFKVILGLINNDDLNTLTSIAESLKKIISRSPRTLIIISSDLSHYPSYDDALYADQQTLQAILSKNVNQFTQTTQHLLSQQLPGLDTCACGSSAIKIGMLLAQQLNLTGYQLHYSNSGDTPLYGDKNKVVGYGAIIFTKTNHQQTNNQNNDAIKLNPTEQAIALKLARHTLEQTFNLTQNNYEAYENYPIFSELRGVFVTLYTKDSHQLRGCIGLIEPVKPLAEGIITMAQSAAFHDPRFAPLTRKELDNIKIEISVLTPPRLIKDIKQIQLGKHGVIIRRNNHSGVYLPQVATETGWDLTTFLSNLCTTKAGLEPNCWQNPDTQIYTFEAQVFEEK